MLPRSNYGLKSETAQSGRISLSAYSREDGGNQATIPAAHSSG